MAESEMDQIRTVIRCSSSIANFHDKLQAYLKLDDWHWWRDRNERVIFFGLYHWKDYLRFIWHRGPKKVFWCGSDILNLQKVNKIWRRLIVYDLNSNHYCENTVECLALIECGIYPKIAPMLFDDPDKYPISYKWSDHPRLFATYHPGREEEYMPITYPDITYLYDIEENSFNTVIKDYQGAIRFNHFDGFAETLAKSLLMGQYPLAWIDYLFVKKISDFAMLGEIFDWLKTKTEPNIEASNYWRKTLKENKDEVVSHW